MGRAAQETTHPPVRRLAAPALGLLVTVVACGCSSTHLSRGAFTNVPAVRVQPAPPPEPAGGELVSQAVSPPEPLTRSRHTWSSLFVFAMLGSATVRTAEVCDGDRAVRIETRGTFLTTMVSVATLGMYTPVQHWVDCRNESVRYAPNAASEAAVADTATSSSSRSTP